MFEPPPEPSPDRAENLWQLILWLNRVAAEAAKEGKRP